MGMQHTNDCHWQRQQLTGDTRRIGRRRKGTLQEFKDSSTAIYFSSSCALVSFSTTICPRVLLSFIVVVVYAVLLLFFCCCCCGSVVAVLWSFECTVLWLFAYVLNNFFALVLFLVFCLRMVFLCVCLFLGGSAFAIWPNGVQKLQANGCSLYRFRVWLASWHRCYYCWLMLLGATSKIAIQLGLAPFCFMGDH